MKRNLGRAFSVALLGIALAGSVAAPAAAGGWGRGHWHRGHHHHGHSSFVLGLSFLVPLYRAPRYDEPPPRVVYVEPRRRAPVCRLFRGDATIDASGRPFYGTACLRGDGRWHIVN